jgi:hypothetical protein
MILRPAVHSALLAAALFAPLLLSAQSLHVESPGPLAPGLNHATIDSFGGDHFWSFTAQPGTFTLKWTYNGPQEGFSTGGHPVAAAAFGPKTPGSVLTFKEYAGGTTFSGKVTQPTRVVIEVQPTKGNLVRQTTAYTLEATGNVSFAAGASSTSAPSVAGIYSRGDVIAKFLPDGSITTNLGGSGHWELFDAESRTYTVILSGTRYSLTYQPGRGFVDNNGSIQFTQKR